MAIKWKHDNDAGSIYFCTFTCFDWIPLFEIISGYDLVYNWFSEIKKRNYETVAYTIMPNHLHTIHYFPQTGFDLNKIISEAKKIYGIRDS